MIRKQRPTVVRSPLINLGKVSDDLVREMQFASYDETLGIIEREVERVNREGSGPGIKLDPVKNLDTGGELFPDGRGCEVRKVTLRLGNSENPERTFLFIASTHGDESYNWRACLEAALQLGRDVNLEKEELLKKNLLVFDPVSDIRGIDLRLWGTIGRDGIPLNAPIIKGWPMGFDPFGIDDRNSGQGRNSWEAIDVMSRSNQAHYLSLTRGYRYYYLVDMHETGENRHPPDFFFHYGGIMFIAEVFLSDEEWADIKRRPTISRYAGLPRLIAGLSGQTREAQAEKYPAISRMIKIRDRVRALGERTYEERYSSWEHHWGGPEREQKVAESIYLMGDVFRKAGINLQPDVLCHEGITTESFEQDLAVRARQQLAVIEAVLWVVGLAKEVTGGER